MALGPGTLGGVGGLLGIAGGITGAIATNRAQTKNRRRQRKAINQARAFADERIAQLTGEGTLFSQGVDFLRGTFGDAANSPLAQDFVKQIRAAQASRGTIFGGGAAAAEAGGLAAFSQDLRTRLLPQLQDFSFAPERLRQSILGFEAPLRVAAKTGAALPGMAPAPLAMNPFVSGLNQGIAGFLGGAQIGIAAGGGRDPDTQTVPPSLTSNQLDLAALGLAPNASALQQLGLIGQTSFAQPLPDIVDPNLFGLQV